MAKVWFARRKRAEWIVPGGRPAYEMPLSDLVFKLDLGPQRWMGEVRPNPDTALAPEDPSALEKVFVETTLDDIAGREFSSFRIGFYDSPYPPAEVAKRLPRRAS
jgi:hypothetical protein